jgi:broad specificity phosphatase PhoE
MVKIILVRHGETDFNKVRRIQGSESDTPLNETGQRQAAALAARLKDEKISAVFSSPLQRAMHTAQAIADCHQLKVTALPSLKEIDVGDLEGRLASDLLMRFDEFICGDGDQKKGRRPPGGESAEDVQNRAWATVIDLAAQRPESTLVLVSHYFVIMTLICRVLNLPVSQMVRLRLSTGTISSFTLDNGNVRLDLFNDGCHNLKAPAA